MYALSQSQGRTWSSSYKPSFFMCEWNLGSKPFMLVEWAFLEIFSIGLAVATLNVLVAFLHASLAEQFILNLLSSFLAMHFWEHFFVVCVVEIFRSNMYFLITALIFMVQF